MMIREHKLQSHSHKMLQKEGRKKGLAQCKGGFCIELHSSQSISQKTFHSDLRASKTKKVFDFDNFRINF